MTTMRHFMVDIADEEDQAIRVPPAGGPPLPLTGKIEHIFHALYDLDAMMHSAV